MASNPLDIVSALFSDKNYINNMTYESAKQGLFIVLRRLAIMYPEQVNVFNNAKINPLDTIKFWSDYLYTGKKAPYWVYTPGAAKAQNKKNESELSKQEVNDYLIHYNISKKDFESAMRIFLNEMIDDVKSDSSYVKKLK